LRTPLRPRRAADEVPAAGGPPVEILSRVEGRLPTGGALLGVVDLCSQLIPTLVGLPSKKPGAVNKVAGKGSASLDREELVSKRMRSFLRKDVR
jgi:hypothetical protein